MARPSWRLIARDVLRDRGRVQLWVASTIVSRCPEGAGEVGARVWLLNPANRDLVGTQLPYLRRGGPLPPTSPNQRFESSRWGGMDAGADNLYPVQTVDGQVHAKGGRALREELAKHPTPLAHGDVVATPAAGRLADEGFECILHAAVPFHGDPTRDALGACYRRAFAITAAAAAERPQPLVLTVPLLGSGACGFPEDVAAAVAAGALHDAPPAPAHIRFVADSEARAEMWLRHLEGARGA